MLKDILKDIRQLGLLTVGSAMAVSLASTANAQLSATTDPGLEAGVLGSDMAVHAGEMSGNNVLENSKTIDPYFPFPYPLLLSAG